MSSVFDIAFMDVCLALIALGWIERFALPMLPDTLVGPNGLLLVTSE